MFDTSFYAIENSNLQLNFEHCASESGSLIEEPFDRLRANG
jgi:hypothetical protein